MAYYSALGNKLLSTSNLSNVGSGTLSQTCKRCWGGHTITTSMCFIVPRSSQHRAILNSQTVCSKSVKNNKRKTIYIYRGRENNTMYRIKSAMKKHSKSVGMGNIAYESRRTCPLYSHTATHTHTHMQVGRRWKMFSAFIPSWNPPPGTARSSGRPAMRRPGTKSKCSVLTWSGSGPTSICSFCMFLLLGFYGGNPGNTGRTCKLHTERPGNKPRHVARCGT